MERMKMCRICLEVNIRMYTVNDKELQELYETLTHIPFVTEDSRPMLACFLCFEKLKQCCQLQRQCQEAEELFVQMMNEASPSNQGQLKLFSGSTGTSVDNINNIETIVIKEEFPADCERLDDDVKPKVEFFEYEIELEPLNNSYSDAEDIPAEQTKPRSEGDVPLIKIKKEVGEEQEVPSKKRRDTTRTAVTKKQNLHTRGKKLEDVITEIQKKSEESDTKVTQNTQSGSSKLIPKYQLLKNATPRVNIGVPLDTKCRNNVKKHNVTNLIRMNTKNPFNCDVSQVSLIRNYHLANQVSSSKKKTYECKYCQRCFSQNVHLTNHVRTHTGIKPYKCEECQLCFSRKDSLTRHIRTHTGEKPYKCEECQHRFSQKDHLTVHIRVHTGEKPYKCEECQICYSQKGDLTKHIRTHTGEKPYKCEECQLCFNQKVHLRRHILTHTGEKPYKCEECQISFNQKIHLTRHIRTHTGEKPYKCEQCQLCFSLRTTLLSHIRTHTGEKPFKCEECQLSFSQKATLLRHVRTHTGIKPYKCEDCQLCFSRKDHLINHIRTHTGETSYNCEEC